MLVKINKRQARKAYENGERVLFTPCKLRPDMFGVWQCKAFTGAEYENRFDCLVNAFEFYNCTLTETGRYTAFYIEK